jgi:hypothetical protein
MDVLERLRQRRKRERWKYGMMERCRGHGDAAFLVPSFLLSIIPVI